jgi:hypothetical protein
MGVSSHEDSCKEGYNKALRKKYYELIDYGNANPKEYQQNLNRLRQLILLEGIPPETEV